MHAMDVNKVNNQCQFWSKLRYYYEYFLFSAIFRHITLTDVFQVIYVMCIVNVMHHSFVVPGSEQGDAAACLRLCVARRHPNKLVAGRHH